MPEAETTPSEETRREEAREAKRYAEADRPPTKDEEAAAEEARADLEGEMDEVSAHERDMNERGARTDGEGRIP